MKEAAEPELDVEDAECLIHYLRQRGWIAPGERPDVKVLGGGVSNRTVLIKRNIERSESCVIKQALAKLRVNVDWYCDPARVHREAAGLRCLEYLLPPGCVPRILFEDTRHHLLGMQAVPQPHENWKAMLLDGRLKARHVDQFGEILAAIHRGSFDRRDQLAPLFDDRTYFEKLRLEPYYAYTASQIPVAAEFLNQLLAQTRHYRLTLVHGDYSPKNVLVCCERLVLLDHEVIHWGDPAFDLGFSLTHFLSKAHFLPALRATFADAAMQYWRRYRSCIGGAPWQDGLESRAVDHTLGCLLARVAGRSTLEYLGPRQTKTQLRVVSEMLDDRPETIADLINDFLMKV